MKIRKITFSVVICTLHNLKGLKKCITSITQQTFKPEEVIIVHGDMDREMEETITEKIYPLLQSKLITLKYVKTKKSLIVQRNTGIDNACSDVVAFLDDDVVLDSNYFYYLHEAYQSKWSENLGGIQGTIIEGTNDKSWWPEEIIKKIFLLGSMTGSGRLLPSGNPSYCGNPKEIRKVEIFNGCMMSFKRDVLLKNRFDTNLKEFWMYDDVELSYRISRKYKLYQTPLPRLHHISSTPNYEGYKKIASMLVFNRLYIFRLYFSNLKINWLLFLWSNIGELFYWIFLSVKIKSTRPLFGILAGWKRVFISKGYPYRKTDNGEMN